MAIYKKGSSGSEVKTLQEALIREGYTSVGKADGVFGKNTETALRKYQQDKGLTPDGIAGKNTLKAIGLSSLGATTGGVKPTTPTTTPAEQPKAPSAPPAAQPPATDPATTPNTTPATEAPKATAKIDPFTYQDFSYQDFTYDNYAQSDIVNQAHALLQQHIGGKPGDYQTVWQDQADSYLSQYQNRDEFSYDFNSDALYNQYKDQYIQQGKMAMMDTMGQAAAMTGGYGNSYAQTVGQQAYNQQLGQLNEIMPELYGMALDRYTQEGQDLLNMYGIYMDKENQEYAKYQDNLNNWYTQLDYLTGQYDSERNYDYNKWLTERNQAYDEYTAGRNLAYDAYSSDRSLAYDEYVNAVNMAYNQERDAVSDAQWQATFDENVRQADRSYALNASKGSGTGGDKEPTYTKLTAEETNKWDKIFGSQTTIEGIEIKGDSMEAAGFDPQLVAGWVDYYKALLLGKEPEKPGIIKPGATGGGSGGGTMYWDVK